MDQFLNVFTGAWTGVLAGDFVTIVAFLGLGMLVWDCLEVGRNDAANIVNAVFGSRILRRRTAIWIAGLAVIIGASAATPVMETARKGIFNPDLLTIQQAIVVYISVYLVDTVLLYSYSAYGMPVSTTACLVFELVGAAFGIALTNNGLGAAIEIVQWGKVGTVIAAIIVSILLAGIAGFLVQRVFRAAIRDDSQDHQSILLHGPWIAGMMLSWLGWFILLKGLKDFEFIANLKRATIDEYGAIVVLFVMWALFTLVVHLLLVVTGERGTKHLFHVTAVLGMICMAFAFGQNDLANCASPGLSAFWLWQHADKSTADATLIEIPVWALFACGVIIVLGMSTRHAQRVTRAAVNTGSQFDRVALYAPLWCQRIALALLRLRPKGEALAPEPKLSERGKKVHYDALRASVIMAVSASVIALASAQGLPVSTTYVGFAAVVATGLADRVMARGDAELKIGRAIWVIFSWFFAALLAVVATACVATVIYHFNMFGLVLAGSANLAVRMIAKRRSDAQEQRVHQRIGTTEEQEWNETDVTGTAVNGDPPNVEKEDVGNGPSESAS
jgi:phosphate/sulfate permease